MNGSGMDGSNMKGGSSKPGPTMLPLFLFFMGLYLLTAGVGFYSSDGEVMYRTTMALAEEHTLAIPCDRSLPQGLRGPDGKVAWLRDSGRLWAKQR